MAARSETWVCGRSLAGIVGSNPAGGMECYIWSGRGLCDRPITPLEEYYRIWCVELSVILKRRQWGGRGPLGPVDPLGIKSNKFIDMFQCTYTFPLSHWIAPSCLLEYLALSFAVPTASPNFILVPYGTLRFSSISCRSWQPISYGQINSPPGTIWHSLILFDTFHVPCIN
jgi:hypothetical protein